MKGDCIGKYFKHITNFYCYNCHGSSHEAIDCKKPLDLIVKIAIVEHLEILTL